MEILIELLVEVFGELFFEIIVECLCSVVGNFANYIHVQTKARKILKYIISALVFSGCLVMVILSFIFKKKLYVILVSSYFLVLLILYILKFLNRNVFHTTKVEPWLIWINRSIHYAFPIVLIVYAALNQNKATPYIITCSSIAIFIYVCMNIYRLYYHNNKNSKPFMRTYRTFQSFINRYHLIKKRYLLNFDIAYLNHMVAFIKQNNKFLKQFFEESDNTDIQFFVQYILKELPYDLLDQAMIDQLMTIAQQKNDIEMENQLEEYQKEWRDYDATSNEIME